MKAAAEVLQIKVQVLAVRTSEDIDAALASMVRERPGALLVLTDRVFLHNRVRLMEFAAEHSLPGVYAYRELVEAGGLMSYGPNYAEHAPPRRGIRREDLKGAKAADLPVEQPTAFELVINLKTAKTLGLSVPPYLLARADEVIE